MRPNDTTPKVAALRLATNGIPVFPCKPDKTPYTPQGFKNASIQEEFVNGYWDEWPEALIGAPTGAPSGLVVLDIDNKGGDGEAELRELEKQYGKLPTTGTSRTPSGGRHIFFKYPGEPVKCSAKQLGPNLDIRGDGGYVIVPGSGDYEWVETGAAEPAEMPPWLLELANKAPKPLSGAQGQEIPFGGRNVTLASLAGRMQKQSFSYASILYSIRTENEQRCNPPLSDGDVLKIVNSITRYPSDPDPVIDRDAIYRNWAAGQAFPLMGLSEIRENLKGPDYLVKPFIERGTFCVMYGESGAFKSFIALDFALCIAFGMPWHNYPVHQGPVVFICGEGQSGMARRVEAWLVRHNLTDVDAPFFLSEVPAALIEDGNAEDIANAVSAKCDAPVMIIIDTLSTNIGEGDESSNPDIARLINNCNLHFRDRFKAAVLVVHHVGHGDKTRERGAYAIRANADCRISVERQENCACVMKSRKMKDGAEFEPVAFNTRSIVIPDLLDSEGEVVSSLVMKMTQHVENTRPKLPKSQEQCLNLLHDMYELAVNNLKLAGEDPQIAKVTTKEWLDRAVALKYFKDSKTQRHRTRNGLGEKAGLIHEIGEFVYLTPVLDEEPEPWL